jgi:hypothetical protein
MQLPLSNFRHAMLWHLKRMPERAVERGVPPRLLGWRWRKREPIEAYLARAKPPASDEVLLESMRVNFPLPRNVPDRTSLDREGDLWGYAMHDVPNLTVRKTRIARIHGARLQFFATPSKGDFFPAIITREGTSLECREISYRPRHAEQAVLGEGQVQRFARATWVIERAYHNYSHWLTAHLPKFLLLKERQMLDEVLMPKRRTRAMDQSLRMLGIEPDALRSFDAARPVEVDELTLVCTDRFDPRHMRVVREAFAGNVSPDRTAARRVFISREKSRGRRITNENRLWTMLAARGFEKLFMEDLPFPEQVRIMQETRILVAPHGAGLTNMLFCPEGGHVVELADPDFPNPNFYNLASGLGLSYWLLHVQAGKADHPLDRDLTVDVAAVAEVLERIG